MASFSAAEDKKMTMACEGGGGAGGGGGDKSSNKNKKKAAFAVSSIRTCATCGAPEGSLPGIFQHKPCGKCKMTYYCGTECQAKHWPRHKKHCKTPEERSVAKAQAEAAASSSSSSSSGGEERNPDKECAICFDDLSNSPSPQLPCGHHFHASCVEELRKANVEEVCPLCRAKLPATAEKMFADGYSIGFSVAKRVENGQLSWGSLNRRQQLKMVEAEQVFLDAAKQEHAGAQYFLGVMYSHGQGVTQNHSKAREWYEKAAKQGHAKAQYELGGMHYQGQGVKQDYSKAREWYEKAAKQDHTEAQGNLGSMYYQGQGVKQDYSKAREWYEKAAKQDHTEAQGNLGSMYYQGKGVKQDYSKAREWFEKAAKKEHANAQFNLGFMYYQGHGVEQSDSLAMRWFGMAAAQGDELSQQCCNAILQKRREQKGKEKEQKVEEGIKPTKESEN